MDYFDKLNHFLETFATYEKSNPGPIPDSIHFDFKKHQGHIVFGSIVHGNEVGSLPGVLKIIDLLITKKIKYGGRVTFFLGNKNAALKKQRFLDTDLNRSFGHVVISNSQERVRAIKIMSLLKSADVFFDFHQTNRPSLFPFYIFSMHESSYYWAQAAGVGKAFVTRRPGTSFSNAGMCSDEYMRTIGKPGITLELGEQGFHDVANFETQSVIRRSLKNMDVVFQNTNSIIELSKKYAPFEFYEIIHKEPYCSAEQNLKEGFSNFTEIHIGEEIGTDENKKPLICKHNGVILFPKYKQAQLPNVNKPLPGELYVVAQKLNHHPLQWL